MTRLRRTAVAGLAAASLCAASAGPAAAQEPTLPCETVPECATVDWDVVEPTVRWLESEYDARTHGPRERLNYEICEVLSLFTARSCHPPEDEWP
jgi:hypothetical protein